MTTILDLLGTSTPVSDALAERLGYVRAAITCRVFFYQQLDDGVCSASVATLARKLGMSTGTVSGNLKWLKENDYIKVIGKHRSGNKRNKYKVGETFYKALKEHSGDESQRSGDESQRSGDESQRSGDESNIQEMNGKEESKESFKKIYYTDSDFSKICQIHESEFGVLSPLVSQRIKDTLSTYPLDEIEWAISRAVEYNKRSWGYVEGILKNHRREQNEPQTTHHRKRRASKAPAGTRGRPRASADIPTGINLGGAQSGDD